MNYAFGPHDQKQHDELWPRISRNIQRAALRSNAKAHNLIKMPWYCDPACPSACTDGKRYAYNPDFVRALDDDRLIFLILHEATHVTHMHPIRMIGHDPMLANIAADYVVNDELKSDGFTLIEGCLYDPQFHEWSYEKVYAHVLRDALVLPPKAIVDPGVDPGAGKQGDSSGQTTSPSPNNNDDTDDEAGADPGASGDDTDDDTNDNGDEEDTDAKGSGDGDAEDDDDGYNGEDEGDEGEDDEADGEGQELDGDVLPRQLPRGATIIQPPTNLDGSELTDEQVSEVRQQFADAQADIELAQALAQGVEPATAIRKMRHIQILEPSWRDAFRSITSDLVNMLGHNLEYSWARPNPRHIQRGIFMPKQKYAGLNNIVVAVDTSGSIDELRYDLALSALHDICQDYPDAALTVLFCDESIDTDNILQYDSAAAFHPEHSVHGVSGGGGTYFHPVFEYIEESGAHPDLLVYITDLYCDNNSYAGVKQPTKTIWLCTNKESIAEGRWRAGVNRPPFGDVLIVDPEMTNR